MPRMINTTDFYIFSMRSKHSSRSGVSAKHAETNASTSFVLNIFNSPLVYMSVISFNFVFNSFAYTEPFCQFSSAS